MSKVLSALLCFCFALSAPAAGKRELLVSAAMSLKDVFTELGQAYESSHPNVKILFNFAGSGQLRAQIEQNAPVDLFAPASPVDMDTLEAKGMIVKESRQNFAANRLVLIQPSQHSQAKTPLLKVDQLKEKVFQRIAIGNPATVPVGRYAKEVMQLHQVFQAIQAKLVFAENARQVLDYVARGEVDAGFVFATDARSTKNVCVALGIPTEEHSPIVYPIAVIQRTQQRDLALDFIAFVKRPANQAIFKKHGFQ